MELKFICESTSCFPKLTITNQAMILLRLITSILFQKLNDQELISKGMNIKMFNQTWTNTEAEGNN